MTYPQIDNSDASAEALYTIYHENGVFLLRSLLTTEQVKTLTSVSEMCYDMGAAIVSNAPPRHLPHDLADGLVKRGYITWARMTGLLKASGTDLADDLGKVVDKIGWVAKSVYATTTIELLEGFSIMRRQRKAPPEGEITRTAWHRDFSFVAPGGFDQSVNFWIPLTEVGKVAPSIEVIVGSHSLMTNVPDETPGITNIQQEWINEHLSDYPCWTPNCIPGDVMVFDHQTVHRTQPLAASVDRLNFEMRWSPPAR
jgi:hypothetical protein